MRRVASDVGAKGERRSEAVAVRARTTRATDLVSVSVASVMCNCDGEKFEPWAEECDSESLRSKATVKTYLAPNLPFASLRVQTRKKERDSQERPTPASSQIGESLRAVRP